MELLNGTIKKTYFKYLAASFGSTLIASIYGMVDMAMVGQYHGPNGSAALAVFAPIWNLIYSLGLLTGIGGSVLFSTLRGQEGHDHKESNSYFTTALICCSLLTLLAWAMLVFFSEPLLCFFGADATLLALAEQYLLPIKFTIPFFAFEQLFAAFLRNDDDPALATTAVLGGGVFNMVGDYFFIFVLDLGIFGAGLATSLGAVLALLLMMCHFLKKRNTLRLCMPKHLLRKLSRIFVTGFPTCITDMAMGIMTILFNRQIMQYLGANALAVYSIIVNISTFAQCCGYSVGQAAQPIFSLNFGAKKMDRIQACLRYALYTAAAFGIFWTTLSLACPNMYVHIFMQPTPEVLRIAPAIIRAYSLSFLLLPYNVFSTFYFQALMQPRIALTISIARGFLISGSLVMLLPRLFSPDAIWYAMLITECVVAIYVTTRIRKGQDM